MRSINIQLSDFEYEQLGLETNELSFSELLDIIGRKISMQTLERSVALSEKHGLSKMTMEEIDKELKALRDAKTDH